MAIRIEFCSERFDVQSEPLNPINPVLGQSFLAWLGPRLASLGWRASKPVTEDWGWYIEVEGEDGRYEVGASAVIDCGKSCDWTVLLRRRRSLGERLRGAGQLQRSDPLPHTVERLIREEAGATDVDVAEDAR